MNRIISPLTLEMRGEEVANLQDALRLLLDRGFFELSDADRQTFVARLGDERAESVYLQVTFRLVRLFQEQRQLEPSGQVDEGTARELNAVLEELGAFSPVVDEHRVVGGQARREDGRPLPGVLVRAFHVDERGALHLGEDTTDVEGRYTIRYAALPGLEAIHLRVVVFDAEGRPLRESVTIRDAQALEIVDLVASGAESATFQVEGRVASRVSAAVGGLRVAIVDKTVGEDVLVARTVTYEGGAYQAKFTDAGLRRRGKERPDLQARVFAGDTFLAASDVRYNASNRETLDILLDGQTTAALRSEYETLTGALSSHFGGRLGDLQETDGRQDVTYLANKTGWDARAVALAALADQFSARSADGDDGSAIAPDFFYALFRAGLPANEHALYQTDASTAEAIWKQGIERGVIPAALEDSLQDAVERFRSLAVQHALDAPALLGVSSLKEMLSVSLGDEEENVERHNKFAELRARHEGDLTGFWDAVRADLGEPAEKRLRLDGQLAYLTLNNAPLVRKLHDEAGQDGLTETRELVQNGYYRAEKWRELIDDDGAVPPEIPGDDEEKRTRYAELLAAQVRLSFPTAVVAQMVSNGETPIADGLGDQVHTFLTENEGQFEIGVQPVERYVVHNDVQVEPEVVQEVTRIQRVYQITPDDDAMNVLLTEGLDSAYAVTRYDLEEFVEAFKDEIGGEANARLVHAKAQQVHNAVLNIAVSYLTAANAPGIGVHSPAKIVDPAPTPPANASDMIAYPTLEGLFGEMDFCECEHCRSILSPAAYLVDLLQFIDPPGHEDPSPQKVLFERRPDIQHLPLTCENTNTPLPYIDVVNETLEYFVANDTENLSLKNYEGHSTDTDATPEELLASPQFVSDAAYQTLAGAHFPPPLPFHQPLENLRRYFDKFEAPLPEVMEALRKDDRLERANAEYGWRDILMEELGLSRGEHAILTDRTLALRQLYGYAPGTSEDDVVAALSNMKDFTRRLDISYEDIVEILKARIVNPHSTLIPKVERLRVSFARLKELKESPKTGQEWLDLLPTPLPDASQYGGDIESWVKNQTNYDNIMALVTVANPTKEEDSCSFDELEFRYTDPDKSDEPVSAFVFVRLIRFIRLWKNLGWTIEQTDKAITALYPASPAGATDAEKLDNGLLTLLPRLGVVKRAMEALDLKPDKDLLPLLACFAPIDTHGTASLYRQMFLSPALPKQDPAFDDNGYGGFLTNTNEKLLVHAETLRAAFQLTEDELSEITAALGFDADTPLDLNNISAVFRRGWLAQKLKLSVREFRYLTTYKPTPPDTFTGLDPFAPPDPPNPPILRLIKLVNCLRDASLKPVQVLNLMWNQDISGKSAPDDAEISGFARTVRSALAAIDSEFVVADDPDGSIARARMALVYGNETADLFFGLLENTFVTEVEYSRSGDLITEVPYTHHQAALEQAILRVAPSRIAYDATRKRLSHKGALSATTRDALKAVAGVSAKFQTAVDHLYAENQEVVRADLEQPVVKVAPGRISYDDFRKRLSFTGLLRTTTRDALKAVAGATAQFLTAVDNLYIENERALGPFFARYPELRPLYDAYVASNDTVVSYNHGQPSLEQSILDAAPGRIAYDDVRKKLSYRGQLTTGSRDALKAVPGVTARFKAAVDDLYAENQKVVGAFLTEHPELLELYEALVASGESPGRKLSVLTAHFLPELKRRRKRQQALQDVSAVANTDIAFASALLDDSAVLHAGGDVARPALDDITAVETSGLSARIFFSDAVPDPVPDPADHTSDAEAILAYSTAGENTLPPNGNDPADPISGIWSGYLEAPENGLYNLRIEADPGAKVTLTLGGTTRDDLQQTGNVWANTEPVELRAGTLYPIVLTVENVRDALAVRWQTTGRGWEIIPARFLYSGALTDRLRHAYVRLLKAASLSATLDLTAAETAYLASHVDYRIGGQSWLNSLPVTGTPNNATAAALFKALNALLDFARIKAELSPGDERLLAVLREPAAATQPSDGLLFALARWEPGSLNTLLAHFGKAAADLARLETFGRVYDAYGWMKKLGMPAAALIKASTNEPTADDVRDLQAALRARYDESGWLDALKPINDALRGLQRDALVAYILHHMRENSETKHIDTPDKLFEHFLMDVQMDPCMQTSRIRHALSSVQLFIERCLMNLEPRVAPSSIKASHWEWMKRYRVWEANRKVFLYPENWLEPELRDDQSPFFRETMSELLQSDITEDRAATALLNYLSKLEEVAKLEPCGIHYVENGSGMADDVAHVVARTAGANRKYYYRRRDGGSWTPWEQITLDIEDNPVIPVVWKGRLFLFWVRIIRQAPPLAPLPFAAGTATPISLSSDPQKSNGAAGEQSKARLADVDPSTLISADSHKVEVQAVLCWSEYYNGKWQQTKTSDANKPASLGRFDAAGPYAFNRSQLILRSAEHESSRLHVYVGYPGREWTYFKLYNTHSLPVTGGSAGSPEARQLIEMAVKKILPSLPPIGVQVAAYVLDQVLTEIIIWINAGIEQRSLHQIREKYKSDVSKEIRGRLPGGPGQVTASAIENKLTEILSLLLDPLPNRGIEFKTDELVASYYSVGAHQEKPPVERSILTSLIPARIVSPSHNSKSAWEAPFFVEDSRHVFYVSTSVNNVLIPEFTGYGIAAGSFAQQLDIPPLVLEQDEVIPDKYGPVVKGPGFGVIDTSFMERFVSEDVYISQGIGTNGTVRFGDKEIGPGGSLMNGIPGR